MRFAIALALSVALVVSASASPVPAESRPGDGSLHGSVQEVWELIKGKAAQQIDEIKAKLEQLNQRITNAQQDAKAVLQEEIRRVTAELAQAYRDFAEKLHELIRHAEGQQSGTSYAVSYISKDELIEKIKSLRSRIADCASELAHIVKQQATEKSETALERLNAARKALVDRLAKLRDDLLFAIRELLIPSDDTFFYSIGQPQQLYTEDGGLQEILAKLRERIRECLAVINDWQNMATEAGRQKIREARQKVQELLAKIKDTIAEWKKKHQDQDQDQDEQEQHTSEPATYVASAYHVSVHSALFAPSNTISVNADENALRELIRKLGAQSKELLQKIRVKQEELRNAAEDARQQLVDELRQLKEQLRQTLGDLSRARRELLEAEKAQ